LQRFVRMIFSRKPQRSVFQQIALVIRTVLLLACLIWSFDAAIAQQPNTRYLPQRDFEKMAQADKRTKLIEKLDAMRGSTFWYQPKPEATSKIVFVEPGKESDNPSYLTMLGGPDRFLGPSKDNDIPAYPYENKFVVGSETSFTVIGYGQARFDTYYLKIEFSDGKIGYLRVYTLAVSSPDEFPVIEHLYPGKESARDFKEYLFSRPPQEVFAAEKKAAAEHYAKQAKANAEWKARGGVTLGMSTAQVLNSNWGKPNKVIRTQTKNGTHEQWVYGNNYLYFENGKLTAVQN